MSPYLYRMTTRYANISIALLLFAGCIMLPMRLRAQDAAAASESEAVLQRQIEFSKIFDLISLVIDICSTAKDGISLFDKNQTVDGILEKVNSVSKEIDETNKLLDDVNAKIKNIENEFQIKTSEVIFTQKLVSLQGYLSYIQMRYRNLSDFHSKYYSLNPDGSVNQDKWNAYLDKVKDGSLRQEYQAMMNTSGQAINPEGLGDQLSFMTDTLSGDEGLLAIYARLLRDRLTFGGESSGLTIEIATMAFCGFFLEILEWEYRSMYMVREWQSINLPSYETDYGRFYRYCQKKYIKVQLDSFMKSVNDLTGSVTDLRSLSVSPSSDVKILPIIPEKKNNLDEVTLSPEIVQKSLLRFRLLYLSLTDPSSANFGVTGFVIGEPRQFVDSSDKIYAVLLNEGGSPVSEKIYAGNITKIQVPPYLQWNVSSSTDAGTPLEYSMTSEVDIATFPVINLAASQPGTYRYQIYRGDSRLLGTGTFKLDYYSKKTLEIADPNTPASAKVLFGSFTLPVDRPLISLSFNKNIAVNVIRNNSDRDARFNPVFYCGYNKPLTPAEDGALSCRYAPYLYDMFTKAYPKKYDCEFNAEISNLCPLKNIGNPCDLTVSAEDVFGVKVSNNDVMYTTTPTTLTFKPYYFINDVTNSRKSNVEYGDNIDYNSFTGVDYKPTNNTPALSKHSFALMLGMQQNASLTLCYGLNIVYYHGSSYAAQIDEMIFRSGPGRYDWTEGTSAYYPIEFKVAAPSSKSSYGGRSGLFASSSSQNQKSLTPSPEFMMVCAKNKYLPYAFENWPGIDEWTVFGICDIDGNSDNEFILQDAGGPGLYKAAISMDDESQTAKFGEPVLFYQLPAGHSLQGIADLDGDGDRDLIISDDDLGQLKFLMNNCGIYTESVQDEGREIYGELSCTADFSGDGKSDLLVLCSGGTFYKLYLSEGDKFSDPVDICSKEEIENLHILVGETINGADEIILWEEQGSQVTSLYLSGIENNALLAKTVQRVLKKGVQLCIVEDLDGNGVDDLVFSRANKGKKEIWIFFLDVCKKNNTLKIRKLKKLKNLDIFTTNENPHIR